MSWLVIKKDQEVLLHPTGTPIPDGWECLVETVNPNYILENFQKENAEVEIPQTVTMRQARLALLSAGLLDSVNTALEGITDETQKRAALIEWEYAATVERDAQWVANLSSMLQLSQEQLDALFLDAAQR